MLLWSWPRSRGCVLRRRGYNALTTLSPHTLPSLTTQLNTRKSVDSDEWWDLCVTQPGRMLHDYWLHTELCESLRSIENSSTSNSHVSKAKDPASHSLRIRITARVALCNMMSVPSLSLPVYYALLCAVLCDGVDLSGDEDDARTLGRASHAAWTALREHTNASNQAPYLYSKANSRIGSVSETPSNERLEDTGRLSTQQDIWTNSAYRDITDYKRLAVVEAYVALIQTLLRHDTSECTSALVDRNDYLTSNITTHITQDTKLTTTLGHSVCADVQRALDRVHSVPETLLVALLRSLKSPSLLHILMRHVITHSCNSNSHSLTASQFARMLGALLLNEGFRDRRRFAAMDALVQEVMLPALASSEEVNCQEDDMSVHWGNLLVRWTQVYGRCCAGVAFYDAFKLLVTRQPEVERRLPTTFYVRLIGLLLDAGTNINCEEMEETQLGKPFSSTVWPTILSILTRAMRLCGHDVIERKRIWVITLKAALTLLPVQDAPRRLLAAHHLCATLGCPISVNEQALQQLLRLVCGALQTQIHVNETLKEESGTYENFTSKSLIQAFGTFLLEQPQLSHRRRSEAAAVVLITLWQTEGKHARDIVAAFVTRVLPTINPSNLTTVEEEVKMSTTSPLLARVLKDFDIDATHVESMTSSRKQIHYSDEVSTHIITSSSAAIQNTTDNVADLVQGHFVWRCLLENEDIEEEEGIDSPTVWCCGQWNEETATHCQRCHRVRLRTRHECRLRARAWCCDVCGRHNRAVDVLLCPHCQRGLQPMDECAICHLPHYTLSCSTESEGGEVGWMRKSVW